MTNITVRPIAESERPEFRRLMGVAFGFDPTDEAAESFNAILELARTTCAFDDGRMIGTAGAFSLEMTVPGGTLPVAGTTMVSVLPTHRRRGALRQMMRAHLDEARAHGDALAGLWASESSIYRRFGFGPAVDKVDAGIDRRYAAFRDSPIGTGTVRLVDPSEAGQLLPIVYDQTRSQRPGVFQRSEAWWEHSFFRDPENRRGGATSYRYGIYEEGGSPRGYVQYRAKEEWDDDGFPNGEVRISDLQAIDLAAMDGLWRYITSIDLIRTIKHWNLPVDDPLPWLLNDPRRLTRRTSDSLWICPIDIPAAMTGRDYSRAGNLVIEIVDGFNDWNTGTYRLETTGDESDCSRTESAPEVRMTASDLGAVYMGGVRVLDLAAVGRIEGSPADLRRADAMFSWHPAPWCPEIF